MQQPGLSRAVPMGVLGFLVGALVVILVRALQSLDPIWDVGTGIVFGTFFCAGFFVWGIGAFDPRLSMHGEEEGDEHHALATAETDAPKSSEMFSASLWQVTFLSVILIIALIAMAKLGPALTSTTDNAASTLDVGMVPMTFAGQDVLVSTLVIFAAFVIVVLISLAAAAMLITIIMTRLIHGITEAKYVAGGGTLALSGGETAGHVPEGMMPRAIMIGKAVVLAVVLYVFFYYVAIGLILPKPESQLILLSLANAVLITVLVMWPRFVIFVVARVAAYVANLLRGGNLRGGKKVDGTQKPKRK